MYIISIVPHSLFVSFTSAEPITPTDTENYLPSDDPIITKSHCDFEKQHNLRQSIFS